MSSSGRYKSQLFNYLSQQSTRLNDNFNRATRHVKVAAVWGVQILLYPVYVLVQATRFTGYQLQQAVKQASPQLKASTPSSQSPLPTADLPIQQVLSAIDTLALVQSSDLAISEKLNVAALEAKSLPGEMKNITVITSESGELKTSNIEAIASSTQSNLDLLNVAEALISNNAVIQGIACDLSSRNLVLVTTANQILDILTSQQQEKLQQRISWELAQFWQQWRLNEQINQEFQPQIKPPVENRKLLPPIRLFWQVITWVQTGPIAIAANLFQEVNLNKGQFAQEFQLSELDASALLLEKLSFLDNAIADLETYPLLPPSGVKIPPILRNQSIQQLPAKATENSGLNASSESEEYKISSLIKAAIDYFFNKENLQFAANNNEAENVFVGEVERQGKLSDRSRNLQLMSATEEEDTWLTSSDLFSDPGLPIKAENPQEKYLNISNSSGQLPRHEKAKGSLPSEPNISNPNNSRSQSIKPNQNPQRPSQVTNNKKNKPVASSRPASPQRYVKAETKANSREITPYSASAKSSSNRNIEETPDWIDTHSTPVGYVKHPLEQLLEWLDRAMLWLEELIVKVWRWINRSIRSK